MASFRGHLYGAAVVSGAASLSLYAMGWTDIVDTQALFTLGVAGGLLPDIDAGSSKPVRGFFSLLGVAAGLLIAVLLIDRLGLLELMLAWVGAFLAVRYGAFALFDKLTVHRGLWHSLLAVAFVTLATASLAHGLLEVAPLTAWLAAGFVGLGYLTHLCLDELSSLDLLGHRVKRSFGTALKPYDRRTPWGSLAMLLAAVALGYTGPPLTPLMALAEWEGLTWSRLVEGALGLWRGVTG